MDRLRAEPAAIGVLALSMARVAVSDVDVLFPVAGGTPAVAAPPDGVGGALATRPGGGLGVAALRAVSLSFNAGDRVALVGRNGSGKSTLLRVLAGVLIPDRGAVHIDGRAAALFNISMGLRKEATGRRNIFLRGLLAGLSWAEARARIDAIAEFADLGPFLDLPVRIYSQGMAMRLVFAMATAFDPDILLIDEWIGAGDAAFRKKAEARMRALVERAGVVVLASHQRRLLREVCDRAVWLDAGRVRMEGPLETVLDAMDSEADPSAAFDPAAPPWGPEAFVFAFSGADALERVSQPADGQLEAQMDGVQLQSGPMETACQGAFAGGFGWRLPDAVEAAASGKLIRVWVVARADVSTVIELGYSTNDVGASGWRRFGVGPNLTALAFDFQPKPMVQGNGDFLGLRLPDGGHVQLSAAAIALVGD
ncbi:MAG: ABC transporter ATP-binding protein [Maricaulaceae bacterium]